MSGKYKVTIKPVSAEAKMRKKYRMLGPHGTYQVYADNVCDALSKEFTIPVCCHTKETDHLIEQVGIFGDKSLEAIAYIKIRKMLKEQLTLDIWED